MVVERIGCPENRKDFQNLMKVLSSHIVIIKCYADWCGPCKRIKKYVEYCFDELRTTDKILMYLNVDEQEDVAAYLKIASLPTLISYKEGMKHQISSGAEERNIKLFFRETMKRSI